MPLFLLTAPSGVGKTTALQRSVLRARQQGLRVGGVLSLAQPHGHPPHPSALWLEDIATGRRRLLAHVAAPAEASVGIWRFLEATVAWGNALLADAADADLLVVDEIGPLELNLGKVLISQIFPAVKFTMKSITPKIDLFSEKVIMPAV
jgi:nucleoside-triphosphatase THEP1